MMFDRIRNLGLRIGPRLHKPALFGAWIFVIGSILALALLLIETGSGTGETARVFGTSVGESDYGAWGLTYHGALGAALLWSQFIAVIGAAIVSVTSWKRGRAAAHLLLATWAALWTFGLIQMAWIAPGFWTYNLLFGIVLLMCVIYRATMALRTAVPQPPAPTVPATN